MKRKILLLICFAVFAVAIEAQDRNSQETASPTERFEALPASPVGGLKLPHLSLLSGSGSVLGRLGLAQASATPAGQSVAPSGAPSSTSPVGITIYDRTRIDNWQWFEAPPASETYSYVQTLLRIAVMQKVKNWDWQLELAQPSILGLPKDAVLAAPQGQLGLGGTYFASDGGNDYPAAAFLKRGFVRYHFHGMDRSLCLGRIEFNEGLETTPKNKSVAWLQANRVAARLIGNFGFSNAQRSLDGVDARYNVGNYHLIVLAARADQGVYNMNGNPEIDVDIQYGAVTHPFLKGAGLWRAFAIGYHDGRTGVVKTDNRPLAARRLDHQNIRLGTYGGDVIWTAPLMNGTFDFVGWGALQNGQWGTLKQSASAGAIEAGYQFDKVRLHPWFRAGEYRSSGDGNAADGTHNTFSQLLPTPRVYARYPFFNSMNLNDQFVSAILKPSSKVNMRSDIHWLQLSNAKDFWYIGGGAFDKNVFGFTGRPSGHSSFASMYDISTDWAVAKQLDMNFYYAHVWGKSVIGAVYPRDRDSNFGYVEFVYHWGIQQRTK
ncbi:MAG TPA: alginate export family protein [Acidisarcina sp.]